MFAFYQQKHDDVSENDARNNKFGNMRRTAGPLWPEGAQKVPPGRPGVRPRASRERSGSVREHPGSIPNGGNRPGVLMVIPRKDLK